MKIIKILELQDIFPIGKYKDKNTIEEVLHFDIQYLEWFRQNVKQFTLDKEVIKEIQEEKHRMYVAEVKYLYPKPSYKITEVDVDMGGGSRDSEAELNWHM